MLRLLQHLQKAVVLQKTESEQACRLRLHLKLGTAVVQATESCIKDPIPA